MNQSYQSLIDQIAPWLPTASLDEMARYRNALEVRKEGLGVLLERPLALEAAYILTRSVKELLGTNLPNLVSAEELIELLNNLTRYNADSVVKHCKTLYPLLKFSTPPENYIAKCQEVLQTWDNTFYFISYGKFIEEKIYLSSYLKSALTPEQLTEAKTVSAKAYEELSDLLFKNNFEPTAPSEDLTKTLTGFLAICPFFPTDYKQRLLNEWPDLSLLKIVSQIKEVILFLSEVVEEWSPKYTEKILLTLFWDRLKHDAEMEFLVDIKFRDIVGSLPEEEETTFYKKALDAIKVPLIENGQLATFIKNELLNASKEELLMKRAMLLQAIKDSSVTEALLDPLNPSTVIENLLDLTNMEEKKKYIDSIQDQVTSPNWTPTTTLLRITAETF